MNHLLNRRVRRFHGDIKPANILINEFGRLKLSDFGLIRDLKDQTYLSTRRVGSERYYSPEMVNNECQSEKSDVWAIGVVLLELAYGRNAFKLDKIYASKPKKIVSRFIKRGGYSIGMAQFVSKCFERKSVNRATIKVLLENEWLKVDINIPCPDIKSDVIKKGNNN